VRRWADHDHAGAFLAIHWTRTKLLIGTCRVWRRPANGVAGAKSNAISPILDTGATNGSAMGDALNSFDGRIVSRRRQRSGVRGMFGSTEGAAILPGHVLSATFNPASGALPAWQDLALNPVSNDSNAMNAFGFDISSIFIRSHDPAGILCT